MIRSACRRYIGIFSSKRKYCAAVNEFQKQIAEINDGEVEYDWQFLTNAENIPAIRENIKNRKGVGDIDEVNRLYRKLSQLKPGTEEFSETKQKLMAGALDIPNRTHPSTPVGAEDQARTVSVHGSRREFNFKPRTIVELGKTNQKLLQVENVARFSGPCTYHLTGELAALESALVRYTFDYLTKQGFSLVSVPDFVPIRDVEKCGFKMTGSRTQVYRVSDDVCLAGTGEMSVASLLADETFSSDKLPLRLATVSRCYRAETADVEREKGLYRVHQFTKVEMFGVTAEDGSESLLDEFLEHQTNLFSSLNLHFRVLDMPSQELGASACRKYDVEAWLPGKAFWGEISSSSNCLDYQGRRLGMKYISSQDERKFCHTVNGTACAVPRMLVAIMENNQLKNGSVTLPDVLVPYMNNARTMNVKRINRNRS